MKKYIFININDIYINLKMSGYKKFNKGITDDGFREPYKRHYRKRNGDIILNPTNKILIEPKDEEPIKRFNKYNTQYKSTEYHPKDEVIEDVPFTIVGPHQRKRESMVEHINTNLTNNPLINISKLLYMFTEISCFIKPTSKKTSLNIEFWDNITVKTLLILNVIFIDDDKPKLNYAYTSDEFNTLYIKQDEFVNLIIRSMFRHNGLNIINQCITFSNSDFDVSQEDKIINGIGVITYALHNDTPDSKIKYFELMKVVVYNMLNLFVKGLAGSAYLFRINPQGSRICFEYHYDLDDWKELLKISRYFNEIFEHIKCTGWRYEVNKSYMKYEFIRYVKSKKLN